MNNLMDKASIASNLVPTLQFGLLNIADGAPDAISCGAGQDAVYIAPNEDDFIATDCETILVQP